MRITLQHACISLVELLAYSTNFADSTQSSVDWDDLRKPSDGTLVNSLAELLIAAENGGLNGIHKRFWEKLPTKRACARLLERDMPFTLENVLKGFTSLRNDGVEGHGIPGKYDPEAELDAVSLTIDRLSHILPTYNAAEDKLMVELDGVPAFKLKLLRTFGSDLVCYREVKRTSSGKCIVVAQIQRSLFEREDVKYETDDAFIILKSQKPNIPEYRTYYTALDDWKPDILVPDRLTDHFAGREREIEELVNWFDDIDSRACMLFGDGGIGKTTLVVEFVHRLLECRIKTEWKPDLITFYTAKQTRWGLNGLEIIKARPVDASDIAISIVRAFEGANVSRDWLVKQPEALIQKLGDYLREFRIERKQHLLIIDNTETLATDEEDVRALAKQIQELSRRVGRVLLTSRRREAIEARQVEIKPFAPDEAESFLRNRGHALDCKPIIQSGSAKLKQYAGKLGNKPLLLEVFIQALGEPGLSLESAFDRVLRMQRQDLGEFLYADAWRRLSAQMKHLLLLMTNVSDVHDNFLLRLCCQRVGVTVIEATDAIGESRGIASVVTIGDGQQITFNNEFRRFCSERTITIDGVALPTQASIDAVKRRYSEFLKIYSNNVRDRVSKAYIHPAAKAAWIANQEGRFADAEAFYEEAVSLDSDNGWLYDRYAYFLLIQKRYKDALDKSIRATQLLLEDQEAWFTRGMIEARLGKTRDALKSLVRARQLGKPEHLCLIQSVYAYVNDFPPDKARARNALESAEKTLPQDQYRSKNRAEIERLRSRVY